LERNLKNLKNAIIFEAGIEIKKFSAHEKTEAETIAKKIFNEQLQVKASVL
jgi:hypothetical protein